MGFFLHLAQANARKLIPPHVIEIALAVERGASRRVIP